LYCQSFVLFHLTIVLSVLRPFSFDHCIVSLSINLRRLITSFGIFKLVCIENWWIKFIYSYSCMATYKFHFEGTKCTVKTYFSPAE
jgi:hypothetical protein